MKTNTNLGIIIIIIIVTVLDSLARVLLKTDFIAHNYSITTTKFT